MAARTVEGYIKDYLKTLASSKLKKSLEKYRFRLRSQKYWDALEELAYSFSHISWKLDPREKQRGGKTIYAPYIKWGNGREYEPLYSLGNEFTYEQAKIRIAHDVLYQLNNTIQCE